MRTSEIVKSGSILLKDKDIKSKKGITKTLISFNCSDALLYCSQSIFYTQLINSVKKANRRIDGREHIDPIIAQQETLIDPEDVVYDILQSMGNTAQTKDVASVQEANDIQVTLQQVMNEPMDVDEMICRSICSIESPELRKRLSNNIVLVGGVCRVPKIIEILE